MEYIISPSRFCLPWTVPSLSWEWMWGSGKCERDVKREGVWLYVTWFMYVCVCIYTGTQNCRGCSEHQLMFLRNHQTNWRFVTYSPHTGHTHTLTLHYHVSLPLSPPSPPSLPLPHTHRAQLASTLRQCTAPFVDSWQWRGYVGGVRRTHRKWQWSSTHR